jgi:hypothetical protein
MPAASNGRGDLVKSSRAVLGILVVAVLCLALAGCGAARPTTTAPAAGSAATDSSGGGSGTFVKDAKDAASIATCASNRAQLDQQYSMAQGSASGAPVDFAAIVQQLGAKCPSGGTYSWDAAANKTRCSVHGE